MAEMTRDYSGEKVTTPLASRSAPTAGAWLATASVLIVLVLIGHGPLSPDLGEQMRRVADGALRWTVVHWMAAASLSLYAGAGLLVLTARTRLTESPWTLSAWVVVTLGSLWTLTTAIAEATVIAAAATTGATGTFEAWWAFAAGKANGFAFVALAVAVIAGHEARSPERVTPAWAASIAVVAALASFAGWALSMWLGVGPASLLWVVSSVLMSAWTAWFGVGLARQAEPTGD